MDTATIAELSQDVVGASVVVYLVAVVLLGVDLAGRIGASRARRAAIMALPVAAPVAEPVPAGGAPGAAVRETPSAAEVPPASDRYYRAGVAVLVLATLMLGAGVLMRGIGTGRVPWGNMYEFSITGALVASVVLLAVLRTAIGRTLAVWTVALITLTLCLAVTVLYVPPGELVPALRHYWLALHVGAAALAFGLFTVAAVTSGMQIVAERRARRLIASGAPLDPDGDTAASAGASVLPSSDRLDRLSYRLIAVAFPIWTVGPLIMGAIWAEVSWGRFWGWDPKEVWALITWLVFAAYLHARATAGWRGTKASAVALAGYGTVLFSYYGVNIFFGGLHAYGGL